MLLSLAAVALAATAAHAFRHADMVPFHMRGGQWYKDALARDRAESEASGLRASATDGPNIFNQLIWHNDTTKGTFQQRWWSDKTNATSGLCLLYISGEGPAGGPPGGYTQQLGYQLGAALYTMEHRYYGQSLPAPLTDAATFMTLSVDTQMADLAAFATMLRAQEGEGCKALGVVGGSYAGALSAWFRETHPDLADFSWSSSGVVNAIFDFTEFDAQIVADLTPDCLAGMRAITGYAEAAWDDPTQRPGLLAMFNTPSYFTREDFLWMLADSGAMGPQYGYKDLMCTYVSPLPPTPQAALQSFANWTITHYGAGVAGACYYSTYCLGASTDPAMVAQWPNQRPWVYQTCRQLAYWQASYPGSIRSSAITTDYYVGQCKAAFGDWIYPNTTDFNSRYGGATPNATKVIALNGSDDPWQQAAVKGTLGPDYPMYLADCDGCGHCGDLGRPSPSNPLGIQVQHQAIALYITQWAQEALARASTTA